MTRPHNSLRLPKHQAATHQLLRVRTRRHHYNKNGAQTQPLSMPQPTTKTSKIKFVTHVSVSAPVLYNLRLPSVEQSELFEHRRGAKLAGASVVPRRTKTHQPLNVALSAKILLTWRSKVADVVGRAPRHQKGQKKTVGRCSREIFLAGKHVPGVLSVPVKRGPRSALHRSRHAADEETCSSNKCNVCKHLSCTADKATVTKKERDVSPSEPSRP